MKIEKLRLKAFRGATKDVSIEFGPDKKITMIFGENGTGKSTIIDGITFLCNQTVGSLEDRSGAGEKKFLVSAGQKDNDLLVELKAANDSWKATLSGKNITVNPNAGYPQLRVLRRAQLSAFVDEAPAERYKRLIDFFFSSCIDILY
jgi:AAA15 family ATPase/GTPase